MNIVSENTIGEMRQFGVYALVFHTTHDDKIYIGSTARLFKDRLWEHQNLLSKNAHWNPRIQSLWNKSNACSFRILEICTQAEDVTIREQWHIDNTQKSVLLNLVPAIPSAKFGRKISEETRARMSAAQKGRVVSPETAAKLSIINTGRPKTPEEIEKIRAGLFGRPCTPETRAKLSAANKGKKPSKKAIEAARAIHLGAHPSQETRKRLSVARKELWANRTPEEKAAIMKKMWVTRRLRQQQKGNDE